MKTAIFIIALLIQAAAFCQPANDDCAGAINISTTSFGSTCTSPTASTTAAATASTPGTACGGVNDDDDVWYSFTANSQTVIVRVSNAVLVPSGGANIGLEVLSGNCGTLSSIACTGTVGTGNGFLIVNGLTIGGSYYLRFWTFGTGNQANFNFCVQDVPAPPVNDDCSGAIAIPTQPFSATCAASISANTSGSTQSTPNPSCTSVDNNDDIWYSFTANSQSADIRFTNAVFTTNSGNTNLGCAIYSSSCPSSTTTFFCSPNIGNGSGHQIVNGLTTGATYYIRFWSFGANNYCSFDFCVQDIPPPPVNDDCSGAIAISTQPFGTTCAVSVSANTTGSTQSTPNPSCTSVDNNDDIWYSFTANSQSIVVRFTNAVFTTSSGNMNLGCAIYSGSCPSSTTTFFCSPNIGNGSGHQIVNGLTIGATYYLRFWTFGTNNYGSFDFCVQDVPPPPVNDDCGNAILVSTLPFGATCASSTSANTSGATQSAPNPSCTSADNNDDIWYSFTANSQSTIIRFTNAVFTTSSGNMTLGCAVYSSSCPASTATFFCSTNIGNGSGHQIINGLTIGATYYIRFWAFGANNYGSFDFCVQDVPPPPANDDCSGAIAVAIQPFGTTCAASVSANTTGSTQSSPNPSCATSDNNDDIWYSFVPTSQSTVIKFSNAVLTTSTGNMSLGCAVYSSACPATTTTLFCSTNIGNNNGNLILDGLTIGATYYLRFWSFGANNYSSFNFCVQEVPAPPANNECASATNIIPAPPTAACISPIQVSTAGATASPNPPACATASHLNDDLWYSFTATTPSHKLVITNTTNLLTGSNANMGYALYAASCPASGTSLICAGSSGSGSASVNLTGLTVGTLYYLRLWSFDLNNYAGFKFCLLEIPLNNECSGAVNIPVTNGFCTTPVQGTLSTATISAGFGPPACNLTASGADVWYKVTVPATGNFIVQTSAINTTVSNLLMEAYTGVCGSLSLLSCDDDGNPETFPSANHARIGITGRTPGEVLYFRVMPINAGNAGDFVICAWDTTSAVLPDISPSGSCTPFSSVDISTVSSNRYLWVPLFDNSGRIIAEVYSDGNSLGNQSIALNVHTGQVRSHAGKYFLDRNISFYGNPGGVVRIRIYYKSSEAAALQGADSSANALNLLLQRSPDSCSNDFGSNPVIISSAYGSYGSNHYLQFSTSSFSTYYLEGQCGSAILWTGDVDTNWHNPFNWSCNGVPGKLTDVIITTGAPRYPVILFSTEINSLTLDPGTSVNISPGVLLKVSGQ